MVMFRVYFQESREKRKCFICSRTIRKEEGYFRIENLPLCSFCSSYRQLKFILKEAQKKILAGDKK